MVLQSIDEAFNLLKLASELEDTRTSDTGKEENEKVVSIATKYLDACQVLIENADRMKADKPLAKRSGQDVAAEKLLRSKADHYYSHVLYLLSDRASRELDHAIKVDEQSKNALLIMRNEIIEIYMQVAEFYVKFLEILQREALKKIVLCGDNAELVSIHILNQRLKGILDRVENLKNIKSTVKVDVTKSNSMKPLKSCPMLSPDEILVLKESSTMSSGLFMPWDDNEALEFSAQMMMDLNSNHDKFADTDGHLKLSKSQIESGFMKWVRPSQVARQRYKGNIVIAKNVSPYNIKQTCVTDCSFIASLCICAAYERRFKRKIVTSLIYPQDRNGSPFISPTGKYMVKFWLNGIARRVFVDDFLPVDRYGHLLCSHVSTSHLDLWVPILEKAYMKLCGGYDFPGSNSAVDMFSLTGWIPERIFFAEDEKNVKDFETPAERAWNRLQGANRFGDCLITVSTSSKLTEVEANKVGLVTAHAYAVLGVIETKQGVRLLQLKNPWMKSEWKGRYCNSDRIHWTESVQRECGYNLKEAIKHNDGIFWICWQDVLQYFQNIFISWNPALFSHKVVTHASWPKGQGPRDDSFNCGENPQYIISFSDEALSSNASVWILLSRHVSKKEQEGDESSDYLTLHVYQSESYKLIWYLNGDEKCIAKGAYSNSPHLLTRIDLTKNMRLLSLVLSQFQKSCDVNYTLSVFCTKGDFNLRQAPELPRARKTIKSAWSSNSAGGPPRGTGFYASNPMWEISSENDCMMQLRCSAAKHLAINLRLEAKTSLRRTEFELTQTPIIDTGSYRNGFVASDTCRVKKGQYLLVPSTFIPGQEGPFLIHINSSSAVEIKEIPRYPSIFKNQINGFWSFSLGTAQGSPNHKNYHKNPQFYLQADRSKGSEETLPHMFDAHLHLNTKDTHTKIGLNMAIFKANTINNGVICLPVNANPASKTPEVACTSNNGVYLSGALGVDLITSLDSGIPYILVVSTFEPREIEFVLHITSTTPLLLQRIR